MNNQQLEQYKNKDPDFIENECFWISTEKLVYDVHNSQIRANGHATNMFPIFQQIFEEGRGSELPPISVRKGPKGWEVMEGNTRVNGARLAGAKILATDYQERVEGLNTQEQWEDFQAQANDHLSATPNSPKDVQKLINRQFKSGYLEKKINLSYKGNENTFVKKAAQHYKKEIYKNAGKQLKWFKHKVTKALENSVQADFEKYSKPQVLDFYKNHTGWGGDRFGAIDNNEVVYSFDRPNLCSPEVIGHVANKKIDNPKVNTTLIYHVGELVGKNPQDLFDERVKIETWFDKVKKRYGWFDNLYFCPQIKTGPSKENLFKLIKVR